MKFLKLIMFIILSACSVATYAKNKEKLVIVHVTDLPKQYSFHQIPPSRFNRYLINHSTLKSGC